MRRCALLLAVLLGCTGDPAAPHLARGNVLVNNGKREEAASEYREAARLAPKAALPLERLGDTLHDLGRADDDAGRAAAASEARPGFEMGPGGSPLVTYVLYGDTRFKSLM